MTKTKQLTIKYWKSLEESSKKRALTYVFPTMPAVVEMLLNEIPSKSSSWWKLVFKKVRVPAEPMFYKTVVNHTFIP